VGGVISLDQLISHEDFHVLMGGRDAESDRKDSAQHRKMAWTALQTLHHIINFNEIPPQVENATNIANFALIMGANASFNNLTQFANASASINNTSNLSTPPNNATPSTQKTTPMTNALPPAQGNIFWESSKGAYRVGPNIIFDFDGRESSFTFPKGVWPPPSMCSYFIS
jgi:hypothetical protein